VTARADFEHGDDPRRPTFEGAGYGPDRPFGHNQPDESSNMVMTNTTTDLSTPQSLLRTFSERLNAHDLDGLVALYEPEAVFEPQPGMVVSGTDAIRAALTELLATQPTITARIDQVLAADDVALVVNSWELTGTAPDETPIRQAGRSADVVRRQPDGRWLVAIDKP
jgi:uncharacterized protein (TIGR02246 family)